MGVLEHTEEFRSAFWNGVASFQNAAVSVLERRGTRSGRLFVFYYETTHHTQRRNRYGLYRYTIGTRHLNTLVPSRTRLQLLECQGAFWNARVCVLECQGPFWNARVCVLECLDAFWNARVCAFWNAWVRSGMPECVLECHRECVLEEVSSGAVWGQGGSGGAVSGVAVSGVAVSGVARCPGVRSSGSHGARRA